MDWETNLAAIIKCTDAHLEQQFQQLGDLDADPSTDALFLYDSGPPTTASAPTGPLGGESLASAFLRESFAVNTRPPEPPHPSAPPTLPTPQQPQPKEYAPRRREAPTSFSAHFRQRQEQKRAARAMDNQRTQFQDDAEDESYGRAPPQTSLRGSVAFQSFASPTYDMASMMEQVRLSLKLEVDARAAIAERQLSALLQLCKATSEELDRLRVEVCAADRQLHTLDQVQAKLRQEITTQKDMGFHLQSLCGKDESWRMQAESQLLELRQMVAALREQCNSVQTGAQDKLSRNELLVHFNAAMEPFKAQFQASAHHNAQQIAEVARTAGASSLMIDALTQKMNHSVAGEMADIKNDISALKTQLRKLFGDSPAQQRDSEQLQADETRRKQLDDESAKQKAKAIEERLERNRRELLQLVEKTRIDISADIKAYVVEELKQAQRKSEETVAGVVRRPELDALAQRVDDNWRGQLATAAIHTETQIKALESQLHSEFGNGLRDLRKQIEQAKQAATEAAKSSETRTEAWESKLSALAKKLEKEQEDRRQWADTTHDALRAVRGDVQQNALTAAQELRVKQSKSELEADKRIREAEKKAEEAFDRVQRDIRSRFADVDAAAKALEEKLASKNEQRVRGLEESISKTNASVVALTAAIGELKSGIDGSFRHKTTASRDTNANDRDDIRSALEKQTSAFVSAIDTSMQRMQLQLQLHLQAQTHATAYTGHWTVPSTPTAPTLMLPLHIQGASGTEQSVSDTRAANHGAPMPEKPKNQDNIGAEAPSDTPPQSSVCRSAKLETPTTPALKENEANTARTQELQSHREAPGASSPAEALEGVSSADKIQETISLSARGAMAEAELAKARVENRRKQELELRQQRQQSPASPVSPLIRGPPAPAPTPASVSVHRPSVDSLAPRVPPSPPAPLARAASASTLPVGGTGHELSSRQDPKEANALESTRSRSMVSAPEFCPPQVSRATSIQSKEPKLQPASASSSATPLHVPPPPPPPRAVAPAPLLSVATTKNPSVSDTPVQSVGIKLAASAQVEPPQPRIPPATASLLTTSIERDVIKRETSVTAQVQALTIPTPPTNALPASPTSPGSPSSVMQKLFGSLPRSPPSKTTHEDAKALQPPPPAVPAPASRANSITSTSNSSGSMAGVGPVSPAHVLCNLCRLPIRKEQREEHESKQCPRRLVECPTCDAKMLWINFDVHTKSCASSRDGPTTSAGDATPARSSSIAPPAPPFTAYDTGDSLESLKKCRHCSLDVHGAELLDHETRCDKVLKQCPHCLRRQKMSELQEHIENCDCRLVSCPNDCGGKFLQRGIEKHIATRCPKKPDGPISPIASHADSTHPIAPSASTSSTPRAGNAVGDAARSFSVGPQPVILSPPAATPATSTARSSSMSESGKADGCNSISSTTAPPPTAPSPPVPAASTAAASSKKVAKVECKFCDEEFSADEIDAHELECDWRPKRCQHCNMVIISRDLARHEASCKTSFKSCQHCNENMTSSALSTHSARCPKRPIKCIRCCQLFPADSIVAHSTTCKYVPSPSPAMPAASLGQGQPSQPPPSSAPPRPVSASTPSVNAPPAPRVPPPPPLPPTATVPPKIAVPDMNDSMKARSMSVDTSRTDLSREGFSTEESTAERMARRSLALSQLTNPVAMTSNVLVSGVAAPRSTASIAQPSAGSASEVPELDEDEADAGSDEDAGEDGEDDDDDDDEHLTLAQVVAEWTVENVCVWLHEDVGVPDVVSRFQQRRCNGAMLLELTESDLVNDFGIRNRIHRERILNAIEAVKMSDDDDDDVDDDDDYADDDIEEDEEDDASDDGTASTPTIGGRHSLAAPSRQAGEMLPSSSAMFRRINSALDLPKK